MMQVDIASIGKRYPVVKACVREVRCVSDYRLSYIVLIGALCTVVQADGKAGMGYVGASELWTGVLRRKCRFGGWRDGDHCLAGGE
jgi:hypothetical protein